MRGSNTMCMTSVCVVLGSLLCVVMSQKAPEITTSNQEVLAVKGTAVDIPCSVQNLGSYHVVWSFNLLLLTFQERRVINDPRVSLKRPSQSAWNLHIDDVTLNDTGTYSCQVNTNPITSANVQLTVLNERPPSMVSDNVTALAGSDVEIECKLPANNNIEYWTFKTDGNSDGQIINENQRFQSRSGRGRWKNTLVINDVITDDEGSYFCRTQSGTESGTALKVVVPPHLPSLEAKAESPNELTVKWKRPSSPHQAPIAGYSLHVLDHDKEKEEIFEVTVKEDTTGQDSFRVNDLTTNSTYTVQLVIKFQLGEKVILGERSPEVNITTPFFMPDAPSWVKIKRLTDQTAEVKWSTTPRSKNSGIVRGYIVTYTPLGNNQKPLMQKQQSLRVEEKEEDKDGENLQAVLKGLETKTKYQVQVKGFTRKGEGRPSKPVIYLHKALPPELSLNGRVLSQSSVLLTVTSMGSGQLANVKMFYTEASEPSWKRLDYSPEWKFTVVGGLEPRTSYFFKVTAKIGGKLKHSVTHITTPPHDLLAPLNVKVTATASTSTEVTWDYLKANDTSPLPLGYIVHLEGSIDSDEDKKRLRQSVVFNKTSAEIKDLNPGIRYNIQVSAFNGFGEGPRTDGLLFHIAKSDVKQDAVNEPSPPRFIHELPERLTVQPGETVKITCAADGFPVPEVKWYDGSEPIGVSAQGTNQLYLANIARPTVLTCRATSEWGEIEASTIIDIARKDKSGIQEGIALGLIATNVMPTTFTVEWTILRGDPELVKDFQIEITNKDDRSLLSQTVPGVTRSFHLRGLQPGTNYNVRLQAVEEGRPGTQKDGVLAEAKISVLTLLTAPVSTTTEASTEIQEPNRYRARLAISVVDITPTSALMEWDFHHLDPRYVQLFELKVRSRTNYTLLTETLKSNINTLNLSLQPGQLYFIQVRAFDRRGEVLASNTTQISTPLETKSDNTIDSQEEAEQDASPVLKRASVKLTSHAVTGDSARLDWTLAGAQPTDIGQFVLKVMDSEQRTLLRQEMKRESRSLTLSNLTPRTNYVVELMVLDDKGAKLAMTTSTLTTTEETSDETEDDPSKVRVFTEEVDTSSVKVAWYTPPKLLSDLSEVSVLLTDIANVTLLTQKMSPLTRSLTVRNLQAGERYRAYVELKGLRGETVRTGFLEFDTEYIPGMPGRPEILNVHVANSTAVELRWRNARSPSPKEGSDDITGYVVNFVRVDYNNQPTQGIYQLPLFGSAQEVVIPNLRGGQRYMFQVAARNQYAFGPLSVPVTADVPRQ